MVYCAISLPQKTKATAKHTEWFPEKDQKATTTARLKQIAAVYLILTSHHHHGHREDLLSVRGGGNVAEADGC